MDHRHITHVLRNVYRWLSFVVKLNQPKNVNSRGGRVAASQEILFPALVLSRMISERASDIDQKLVSMARRMNSEPAVCTNVPARPGRFR